MSENLVQHPAEAIEIIKLMASCGWKMNGDMSVEFKRVPISGHSLDCDTIIETAEITIRMNRRIG